MTTGASTVRRLVITGRVQGVGFRFALADEARARNLSGRVRNCADGSVEVIVAGAAADADAIVAWAHHGPPAASVTGVRVEAASGEFATFEIAPAAR
ncbi:MAG: acylphosphatase [Casimicrobiaceae bacterium]